VKKKWTICLRATACRPSLRVRRHRPGRRGGSLNFKKFKKFLRVTSSRPPEVASSASGGLAGPSPADLEPPVMTHMAAVHVSPTRSQPEAARRGCWTVCVDSHAAGGIANPVALDGLWCGWQCPVPQMRDRCRGRHDDARNPGGPSLRVHCGTAVRRTAATARTPVRAALADVPAQAVPRSRAVRSARFCH